jgi:single-strand DNA-binding protein
MNNLNSVLIEGNLARDPDCSTAENGAAVCKFTIAYTRCYKEGGELAKEVGLFDAEASGKLAESMKSCGKKERGVRVVGKLRQDCWQGPDGRRHSKILIAAEHIEFRPEFAKQTATEEAPEV